NLKELVSAMQEFETLGGFLEHISLVMENTVASQGAQVSLMTLHAAKGLEFDVVFLPGWEEGVFPNQRALDENGAAGLEEERRLAYVGITRARRQVEISFAANRRMHGLWQSAIPSRFVQELPNEHVEIMSESGLYGGGRDADTLSGRLVAGDLWDDPGAGDRRHGPGYGRRRGRDRPTAAPTIDGQGYLVEQKPSQKFAVGDRVFHQKFGMGDVVAVDGGKLDIAFDKAGRKKVVDSFVSYP
ncbi:MAG: ATP-dependent helicase, partial [Pseudomonadota bacterium]|nr:ATP-dependent helicase [Pseudomonadota bacterium]